MPKIPIYQQQVGVAAGGLGPRANSAAFEAPGKATAAFGEQLGDVAYKLAEQERKREDRRILQEESEAAKRICNDKKIWKTKAQPLVTLRIVWQHTRPTI